MEKGPLLTHIASHLLNLLQCQASCLCWRRRKGNCIQGALGVQAGQNGEQVLGVPLEKCWQKGAVGRGPRQDNRDQQGRGKGTSS